MSSYVSDASARSAAAIPGAAKSESRASAIPSRKERYAQAARRMQRGKQLVITGFVVGVAGMLSYCVACLSADAAQQLGASAGMDLGWLVAPTLAIIGLGTLLWLAGSYLYLTGGMDSDPDGPDLYF